MREIKTKDFSYELPADRIAQYPLEKRDESKLLIYNKGTISHSCFKNIGEFIPEQSSLYFNNTRVIPARLIFKKESGAEIELFMLQPIEPSLVYEAMQSTKFSTWKCTIGNLKRWPDGLILMHRFAGGQLNATLKSREQGIVIFSWDPPDLLFAEIVRLCGATPLPPYLKRKADSADKERYQTVYSQADGAVAAPTAGLHFTDGVLDNLRKKNIGIEFLTLHVSAGTFLPIKTENALDHTMHTEQVLIQKQTVERLLEEDKTVIAVGTTSLRTLESLYWCGVKLINDTTASFTINKLEPYQLPQTFTKHESLHAILKRMDRDNSDSIIGETSIFITPGYRFKICNGLITNFHQPSSTLMLLIAAFVGEDWKRIYAQALENKYRFLSYGDSSLLLPPR